jgi:hypothetical protein
MGPNATRTLLAPWAVSILRHRNTIFPNPQHEVRSSYNLPCLSPLRSATMSPELTCSPSPRMRQPAPRPQVGESGVTGVASRRHRIQLQPQLLPLLPGLRRPPPRPLLPTGPLLPLLAVPHHLVPLHPAMRKPFPTSTTTTVPTTLRQPWPGMATWRALLSR